MLSTNSSSYNVYDIMDDFCVRRWHITKKAHLKPKDIIDWFKAFLYRINPYSVSPQYRDAAY